MWLDDLLSFWFPPQRDDEDDPLPDVEVVRLPYISDIPEFYLRPELIPIEEPDGAAVEEAERVLRR